MMRQVAGAQLYDPRTAEVVRAEQVPSRVLVFGITAVVCGVMGALAHYEWPFLAYWSGTCSPEKFAYKCAARWLSSMLAGVGTAALLAAFCLILHRIGPIRPTVTCRGCGKSGWVLDIEPHGGRCPCCGGDRFDYRIWFGSGNGAGPRLERVREDDMPGAELVTRFRKTRACALRRYY
jgi:hypothetical protein